MYGRNPWLVRVWFDAKSLKTTNKFNGVAEPNSKKKEKENWKSYSSLRKITIYEPNGSYHVYFAKTTNELKKDTHFGYNFNVSTCSLARSLLNFFYLLQNFHGITLMIRRLRSFTEIFQYECWLRIAHWASLQNKYPLYHWIFDIKWRRSAPCIQSFDLILMIIIKWWCGLCVMVVS